MNDGDDANNDHDDNKGKYDEFDDNIDDNKLVKKTDDDGDVTSSPSY